MRDGPPSTMSTINGWAPAREPPQAINYKGINSRIMLTIFLCLLFVAVVLAILQLYARHVLRRNQRRISDISVHRGASNRGASNHTSPGLKPSSIAALPAFPYRKTIVEDDVEEGPAECTVCLSGLEEGEVVRLLLNCQHMFHVECIDMWLHSHTTCPVCRANAEAGEAVLAALPPLPEWFDCNSPAEGSSGAKEGPSGLGSSFRRMMSWDRSGRRVQSDGNGVGDVERQ